MQEAQARGDGNNLAHSWLKAATRFPFNFILACPEDYLPDEAVVQKAEAAGASVGAVVSPPLQASTKNNAQNPNRTTA